MKTHFPLKLTIAVLVLFALIITGLFVQKTVRYRYWRGRLVSQNNDERVKAIQALLAMEPSCRDWLVHDCVKEGSPYAAGIAVVLANAGNMDYTKLDREDFINFTKAIADDKAKRLITEEYITGVRNHYFTFRPSGRSKRYYELLYKLRPVIKRDELPTRSAALDGALFLRNCQFLDGRWASEDGTLEGDMISTGFALLSLLSHGQTHRVGKFKKTVKKGLDFLLSQIDEQRKISENVFVQAICTWTLCDAYAYTRDKSFKGPAQKAVDNLLRAQEPGYGWGFEPRDGKSNTFDTAWAVLALRAAKMGKLEVPESSFDGTIAWFNRITRISDGKVGFIRPGDDGPKLEDNQQDKYDNLPTMTAMAILCRILCGQKRTHTKIQQGVKILMANWPEYDKPQRRKANVVYWYFGTYAMFQIGGPKWQKWNQSMMKNVLLPQQRDKGHLDGSWDPVMGQLSEKYGRAFTTSMCTLTFGIYYAYRRSRW